MKKLLPLFLVVFLACEKEDPVYQAASADFAPITYLSRTNENVQGGSQYVYLIAGLSEADATYCFCQIGCNRSSESFYELGYNSATKTLRFKKNPTDDYTLYDTSDWCIQYK